MLKNCPYEIVTFSQQCAFDRRGNAWTPIDNTTMVLLDSLPGLDGLKLAALPVSDKIKTMENGRLDKMAEDHNNNYT